LISLKIISEEDFEKLKKEIDDLVREARKSGKHSIAAKSTARSCLFRY
jgi:hypothetical protein